MGPLKTIGILLLCLIFLCALGLGGYYILKHYGQIDVDQESDNQNQNVDQNHETRNIDTVDTQELVITPTIPEEFDIQNPYFYIFLALGILLLLTVYYFYSSKPSNIAKKIKKQLYKYVKESNTIINSKDNYIYEKGLTSQNVIISESQINHIEDELSTAECMSITQIFSDPNFKNTQLGLKNLTRFLTAFGLSDKSSNIIKTLFNEYRNIHGEDIFDIDNRINNIINTNYDSNFDKPQFLKNQNKLKSKTKKLDKRIQKTIHRLRKTVNYLGINSIKYTSKLLTQIEETCRITKQKNIRIDTIDKVYVIEKQIHHQLISAIHQDINKFDKIYEKEIQELLSIADDHLKSLIHAKSILKQRGDNVLQKHHDFISSITGYGITLPDVSNVDWDLLDDSIKYCNKILDRLNSYITRISNHKKFYKMNSTQKSKYSEICIKNMKEIQSIQDYRDNFIDRFNRGEEPS